MTQEDFDHIIFESLDHLSTLTAYFEGKRVLFGCNHGDYASGLRRAYDGLIHEVNLPDYERTVFVFSNGESMEENLNDIKQVEFLKNKQRLYTHPYKKHIDLHERTHGRIKGILTNERLQKISRPLSNYLKTLETMIIEQTIDDILNSMLPLNSVELDTIKENLNGGNTYLYLIYIGTKTALLDKLKLLRVQCGIERKEIARVFAKCVRWRSNYSSAIIELTKEEIYKKI